MRNGALDAKNLLLKCRDAWWAGWRAVGSYGVRRMKNRRDRLPRQHRNPSSWTDRELRCGKRREPVDLGRVIAARSARTQLGRSRRVLSTMPAFGTLGCHRGRADHVAQQRLRRVQHDNERGDACDAAVHSRPRTIHRAPASTSHARRRRRIVQVSEPAVRPDFTARIGLVLATRRHSCRNFCGFPKLSRYIRMMRVVGSCSQ
jgi:hypothetical protein